MGAGRGLGCVENGGSNLQFSLPLPDLTGASALRKGLYWIMQTDLGAMAGEGEVGGRDGGWRLHTTYRTLSENFGESLRVQPSIFGGLHTPQASN